MSVRVPDGRFNLRQLVGGEEAPLHAAEEPLEMPERAPVSLGKFSGLKFDFSSLQKAGLREAPFPVAAKPTGPVQLRNAFDANKDHADVIRLSVLVDDLTARLRKATERVAAAEAQLQKTHSALVTERHNAAIKAASVDAELGAAKATHEKLRAEVTAAKAHSVPPAMLEAAIEAKNVSEEAVRIAKEELQKVKDDAEVDKKRMLLMNDELINVNDKRALAEQALADTTSKLKQATEELEDAKAEESMAALARANVAEQLASEVAAATALKEKLDEVMRDRDNAYSRASEARMERDAVVGQVIEARQQRDDALEESARSTAPVAVECAPYEGTQQKQQQLPDPVRMHKSYEGMRRKLASLAERIESGEDLEAERQELYQEAASLKRRYDAIFGAVDPERMHVDYDSEEDEAPPTGRWALSAASTNPLGGAAHEGMADCCVEIGSRIVRPFPTGNHTEDTNGDAMVKAVVADLAAVLKDATVRAKVHEALYLQAI